MVRVVAISMVATVPVVVRVVIVVAAMGRGTTEEIVEGTVVVRPAVHGVVLVLLVARPAILVVDAVIVVMLLAMAYV